MGSDDREYRAIADYDERYSDAYLIDAGTGARTLLAKKQRGSMTWSPSGRYLLFFDGKDWNTVSVPDGKKANLTASLGVKFFNEDTDTPSTPGPYGSGGWTQGRQERAALRPLRHLAGVAGRHGREEHHRRLRPRARSCGCATYARGGESARAMDRSGRKPLMLQAREPEDVRDRLLPRVEAGGGDRSSSSWAAKYIAPPVKAKDADVYLLTAQTFSEYPRSAHHGRALQGTAQGERRQPAEGAICIWGKAELVHYKNADGVPLSGVLFKPENFDPTKKYPMMVYIYERLSQNVHRFVRPAPGHVINPTLLRQQRLPRAACRTSSTRSASRARAR